MSTNLETQPPTILLVEDDDEIRMGLSEVLEAEGYRVIQSANALGAMGWLSQGKSCDLLVTDFMMPGDSIAMVKYIRARGIPTIMLSAAYKTLQARLHKEGMHEIPVIPKPFNLEHIIAEVQKFLPLFASREVEVWAA